MHPFTLHFHKYAPIFTGTCSFSLICVHLRSITFVLTCTAQPQPHALPALACAQILTLVPTGAGMGLRLSYPQSNPQCGYRFLPGTGMTTDTWRFTPAVPWYASISTGTYLFYSFTSILTFTGFTASAALATLRAHL